MKTLHRYTNSYILIKIRMPWKELNRRCFRLVSTDKSIGVFFTPTLPSPIPLLSSIHATSFHREDSVTTRQARPSSGESRNLNDSVISGRLLEALLFHRPHCKVIFLVPVILNSIDRAPRVEISSAEHRENSYKESNETFRLRS